MELPIFPDRIYGKLMTKDFLQRVATPTDTRRLLYAHNAVIQTKLENLTSSQWTWLLSQGRPENIKVTHDNKTWSCYGSSNMAILCMELFGVLMPKKWYADQPVSNLACFILINNACPNKTAAQTIETITVAEWDAIRAYINQNSSNQTVQETLFKACFHVLYSICRTGNYSRTTEAKLKDEIMKNKAVNITLDNDVVKEYWDYMGRHYTMDMIQQLMESLRSIFGKVDTIRVRNLIDFAKERGLTQYYAVKRAFAACSDFPWWKVHLRAPLEFQAYERARDYVKDRPYFGYTPDLKEAAAGNYPTLAYISVQLLQKKLGQTTFTDYTSQVGSKINKREWDDVINTYLDQKRVEPTDMERDFSNRAVSHYLRIFQSEYIQTAGGAWVKRRPGGAAGVPRHDDSSSDDEDDTQGPTPPDGGTGSGNMVPPNSSADDRMDQDDPDPTQSHSSGTGLPPTGSQTTTPLEKDVADKISEISAEMSKMGETPPSVIQPIPTSSKTKDPTMPPPSITDPSPIKTRARSLAARAAEGSTYRDRSGDRNSAEDFEAILVDYDISCQRKKYKIVEISSLTTSWDCPADNTPVQQVSWAVTDMFENRKCVIYLPPKKHTFIVRQAGMEPIDMAFWASHDRLETSLALSHQESPYMLFPTLRYQGTLFPHDSPHFENIVGNAISHADTNYVVVQDGVLFTFTLLCDNRVFKFLESNLQDIIVDALSHGYKKDLKRIFTTAGIEVKKSKSKK